MRYQTASDLRSELKHLQREQQRWLSDGRRLLFHRGGKLQLVDSQSRRVRDVLSAAPHEIEQWYALSSDDRVICFTLIVTEADIWLASPEGN